MRAWARGLSGALSLVPGIGRLAMEHAALHGERGAACSIQLRGAGRQARLTASAARAAAAAAAAAAETLVVVESPAKAKKIQTYLGPSYQVVASYGSVRKLPDKQKSVDPDNDFALRWELVRGGRQLDEIAGAMASARSLILATDPDREGEAIAWHVQQELQARGRLAGKQLARITFTEVTRAAVLEALAAPRQVSAPLVDASLARVSLDYLVGFTLSPLLWRKLRGARSAGRVQSVALRLLAERECEIDAFTPAEFWTFAASLRLPSGEQLQADLIEADGRRLSAHPVTSAGEAERLLERLQAASFTVASLSQRTVSRAPQPPFSTSALQQAASSLLGFAPAQTMQLAQQLYEGLESDGEGFITYIRTDAVHIEGEALQAVRSAAAGLYGEDHLSPAPRTFKSKAKNAQEAHEAIRPTNPALAPAQLPAGLPPQARQLYELIWRRTLACQMADSRTLQTSVQLASGVGDLVLRAGSSEVQFQGFRAAYHASLFRASAAVASESDEEDGPASVNLSDLKEGQALALAGAERQQNWTAPPRRFSEAALVGRLEELGIGRPSTYASIIRLLQERGYVVRQRRSLHVQPLGRYLAAFLAAYFARYVDYGFTSRLEAELDRISAGDLPYKHLLRDFWGPFDAEVRKVYEISPLDALEAINQQLAPLMLRPQEGQDAAAARRCPACGGELRLALGKGGNGFVGCSGFPECRYVRSLEAVEGEAEPDELSGDGKLLGTHPQTGGEVRLKRGRFGPYLEVAAAGGGAPQRAGFSPEQLEGFDYSVEAACELVAAAQPVTLGVLRCGRRRREVQLLRGPYGHYLKCGKTSANVPKELDASGLALEDALCLLAAKAPGAKRSRLPSGYAAFGRSLQAGGKRLPQPAIAEEWRQLNKPQQQQWAAQALAEWRQGREPDSGALAPLLGLPPGEAADVEVLHAGSSSSSGGSSSKAAQQKGKSGGSAKRPASGYVLFCSDVRARLKQEGSQLSPPEVMRAAAAEWRALPPEQQQAWSAKAAAAAAEQPASNGSEAAAAPAKRQSGSRGEGKHGGGKRPVANPYLLYSKERRPAVAAANAGAAPSELVRLIAAEWRALPPAAQDQWRARAAAAATGPEPAAQRELAGASSSPRAVAWN